jgi:Spt5 transcription elongation factor, acidic N-terminal.
VLLCVLVTSLEKDVGFVSSLCNGCVIFFCLLMCTFFSSQKEDEIEEYLRKKYADESAPMRHFGDGGEEMSDEITQQTLLPGVK